MANSVDDELRSFVKQWCEAIRLKDVDAARRLRHEGFRCLVPGGEVLSRENELSMLSSIDLQFDTLAPSNLEIRRSGRAATLNFECAVQGQHRGEPIPPQLGWRIEVLMSEQGWLAVEAAVGLQHLSDSMPRRRFWRRSPVQWLLDRLRGRVPGFQDLAFLPYRPGQDYLLPSGKVEAGDGLPIPPERLWLGSNYPVHGAMHVKRMLDVVAASGFRLGDQARILDLGCGAGRMIRHLQDLASSHEIWGLDISAEHILWCQQNLSPPFHFATITKVPHLPFEDRSFALVYGGSLFTHIDDLAKAWLLELHRILAPDGRLYLTIHDENTLRLLAESSYAHSPLAKQVGRHCFSREASESFGMFTIGRDDRSQVFYARSYFLAMAEPMFEVLSVTEEAYFYQTALVLQRRRVSRRVRDVAPSGALVQD